MPAADHALRRLLSAISLDGLRGFEAAARRGSFTAAAEELCVTQSAISKQIRSLEDALGQALFIRQGRSLHMTEQGHVLYAGAQAILARLSQVAQDLTEPARRTIAITMPPAFATLWLAPRLAEFQREAPDVDLRIDASPERLNLARQHFDLAIRMATSTDNAPTDPGASADDASTPLFRESLQLVASPDMARRITQPTDLLDIPLLRFEHPIQRQPGMSWAHWFKHLGLKPRKGQGEHRFAQYELLLRAATDGLGLAIGRRPLVDPLIEQGHLAVVLPALQMPGPAYRLHWRDPSNATSHMHQFVDWLRQQCSP